MQANVQKTVNCECLNLDYSKLLYKLAESLIID